MAQAVTIHEKLFHSRAGSTHCVVLACLVVLCVAALPACKVSISNPAEEVVFNFTSDACDPLDYPDTAARFFRANDGTLTMMDSNSQGYHRSLRAAGQTAFVRDCSVVFNSGVVGALEEPQQYNNSLWLHSIWAMDDVVDNATGTLTGLIHNEFHGAMATANKSLCPSGNDSECLYWNALAASSVDGGRTFQLPPYDVRTAIVSPNRYVPDGGEQGMCTCTNIVRGADGAYYVMSPRTGVRDANGQLLPRALCTYRSLNISDMTAWRGWDGSDFTIDSRINPYTSPTPGVPCNATGPEPLHYSVVFSDVCGVWVSVGTSPVNQRVVDVVYATSSDLLHWSDMVALRTFQNRGSYPQEHYPSIADVEYEAAGRNFDHVAPHLTCTTLKQLLAAIATSSDRRCWWRRCDALRDRVR